MLRLCRRIRLLKPVRIFNNNFANTTIMEPTRPRFIMDAAGRTIWSPAGQVPQAQAATATVSAKAGPTAASLTEKRMISIPDYLTQLLSSAAKAAMPEL